MVPEVKQLGILMAALCNPCNWLTEKYLSLEVSLESIARSHFKNWSDSAPFSMKVCTTCLIVPHVCVCRLDEFC